MKRLYPQLKSIPVCVWLIEVNLENLVNKNRLFKAVDNVKNRQNLIEVNLPDLQ